MGWTYLRDPALVLSPVAGWGLLAGPDPDWDAVPAQAPSPDWLYWANLTPTETPYQTTDQMNYCMTSGVLYTLGGYTGSRCSADLTAGVPQP